MFCVLFFFSPWVDTISCPVAKRREWVGKAKSPIFQTYLQNRLRLCSLQGFGFLKNRMLQLVRWREWEAFYFFEKWAELFLDLQCHPAESWELPVTGLMQCLGKSRRVHMTQQNIRICIPISWEAGLISTNKCCGPVRVLGWVCHRRIKRNLKKKKRLRGGEHLNYSGTFLLGYIPIRQTQTWQSYAIAQCQKHSPGMRDMWTWTPPTAPLYGPAGRLHYKHTGQGTRTCSIEKGRDLQGKLSAAFLPVGLCRLTIHSDEPKRDGKWALGNRSVDLFALRRKQEYELTSSFSGFVLGLMSPGKKERKKSCYNYLFPNNSKSNI